QSADKQWPALQPSRYESMGGATMKLLPDSSILASDKNPQADTYKIEAPTNLRSITGVRIEVLPDPGLPHGGPGRDAEGNFFLSDFDLEVAPSDNPQAKQHVVWTKALADESQDGYSVEN